MLSWRSMGTLKDSFKVRRISWISRHMAQNDCAGLLSGRRRTRFNLLVEPELIAAKSFFL